MKRYQFERIYSLMEKEFGKIKVGQEEEHAMMLFTIESNLLKIHRKYPASNSRRLREAIALALFNIKSKYTGEEFALDEFRNKDNERLEHSLLMAFDPFVNDDIQPIIIDKLKIDLTDRTAIQVFYSEPIICILRIKDSIDAWEKRMGSNGYFDFIEKTIGDKIVGDEMNFVVRHSTATL